MTTKYECDGCGRLMDFDDEKSCVMAFGAGREGANFESNKQLDLCPECTEEVKDVLKKGLQTSRNFQAKGKVK